MRLEEELQQKKFSSELLKAILNIEFTGNWLDAEANRVLKPFEISSQQYNVLRILKGQGDNAISVNNIMGRMINKMSNASRLVEKLRKKGLIERVTCESDRRQVDVRITKKGLKLLVESGAAMNKFDKMKSKLTEKEAKQLNELLEKIRE
jgi:DNA-binding MarR family transcriptional regulator